MGGRSTPDPLSLIHSGIEHQLYTRHYPRDLTINKTAAKVPVGVLEGQTGREQGDS